MKIGMCGILEKWKTNTVFGWVEYREDGKYKRENGVENSVFHCLGMGRK